MAFRFTLPELQAELRALGHDGLPDHLILNVLSQLNLPLPSPTLPALPPQSNSSFLDSSDTDAGSFCSTHSLSCSPKEQFLICAGHADLLPSVELFDGRPQNQKSCQASAPLLNSSTKPAPLKLQSDVPADDDPWRLAASPLLQTSSSGGIARHTVQLGKKDNSSSTFESERIERGRHTSLLHVSNHKPNAGCEAGSAPQSAVRQEVRRQISPAKIIEHYWISVGEEHMRAMHSRSPSREQIKRLPPLELKNPVLATGTREGKSGYGSLIEKVEQCEGELQRLTLRLQAQQRKRPWFLEAARKPRVLQTEKHDVEASNIPVHASYPVCTSQPEGKQIGQFTDGSRVFTSAVPSKQTCTEIPAQENESSLLIAQEFREGSCVNLAVSKGDSKQLVDKEIYHTHTLETEPASTAFASKQFELKESSQPQDQNDVTVLSHSVDQTNESDSSVCSKSSSASYQHSRSSGDSRSNGSQQVSPQLCSRKNPCSTLQQPRRRGGKIDRVARFAEMQRVWKKDAFLVANEAGGKRKGIQGFYHQFSNLRSTRSY